jgi:hypothetical protein
MAEKHKYIALHEAVEGMKLSASLYAIKQGIVRGVLPACILDADSLHRLRVLGIEFLAVSEPDNRTPEEVSADMARHVQRLNEIFSHTDFTNPAAVALYDRVLIYRGMYE